MAVDVIAQAHKLLVLVAQVAVVQVEELLEPLLEQQELQTQAQAVVAVQVMVALVVTAVQVLSLFGTRFKER